MIILTQSSRQIHVQRNNRSTRTRCKSFVKVSNKAIKPIKPLEQRYFKPCCSVFIFNFEQVNAGWEDVNGFKSTGRVSSFFVLTVKKG